MSDVIVIAGGVVLVILMICVTQIIMQAKELEMGHAQRLRENNPLHLAAIRNKQDETDSKLKKLESDLLKCSTKNTKDLSDIQDLISIFLKKASTMEEYKKKVDALAAKAGFGL